MYSITHLINYLLFFLYFYAIKSVTMIILEWVLYHDGMMDGGKRKIMLRIGEIKRQIQI